MRRLKSSQDILMNGWLAFSGVKERSVLFDSLKKDAAENSQCH